MACDRMVKSDSLLRLILKEVFTHTLADRYKYYIGTCCLSLHCRSGCSRFLQNTGICLPDYTVSYASNHHQGNCISRNFRCC
jgi:hypothetical protein